jgi:hypothetical protein
MGKGRKHTPEQIVNMLRLIELATSNGKTNPTVCQEAGLPLAQGVRRVEGGPSQASQGA